MHKKVMFVIPISYCRASYLVWPEVRLNCTLCLVGSSGPDCMSISGAAVPSSEQCYTGPLLEEFFYKTGKGRSNVYFNISVNTVQLTRMFYSLNLIQLFWFYCLCFFFFTPGFHLTTFLLLFLYSS